MEKKRLIFIDDHARTCKYFRIKAAPDYDVSTVETVEEALSLIDRPEQYDIVISDYKFDNHEGDTNGLDLLNMFKEKNANSFLALCSAYDQIEATLKGQSDIVFLKKPMDYDSFNEQVNAHFATCKLCSVTGKPKTFVWVAGGLITALLLIFGSMVV